jgi:hypothetical protein
MGSPVSGFSITSQAEAKFPSEEYVMFSTLGVKSGRAYASAILLLAASSMASSTAEGWGVGPVFGGGGAEGDLKGLREIVHETSKRVIQRRFMLRSTVVLA